MLAIISGIRYGNSDCTASIHFLPYVVMLFDVRLCDVLYHVIFLCYVELFDVRLYDVLYHVIFYAMWSCVMLFDVRLCDVLYHVIFFMLCGVV